VNLARILTIISVLIFGGIGFACLFFPVQVAAGIDISLPTPTAIIDFRATYGGFLLGLGLFFIYCLFNKTFLRVGLIVQAVSLGGFAFGRIVGLALDGTPKTILIYFLIAEIIGCILAIYAFMQISKVKF
jgi:hypothetical protein